MDFPRNSTTNVHKIEGVLFIQWTVYSPEQSTIHGADNGFETFNRRSSILQEAENALRYGGYHVLYDDVQGVLWIFDLSGPNLKKDSRSDHQRGAAAVFEHYGLKKLLFGSLRASDLTESTSTAQRLSLVNDYQYHSWLHPKFLYKTGRMHSGWTASVAQDNVSIYSKIILAISMSLSYFLARSGGYIPLSSHFFLSLLPVESQPLNVRLRSPFEPAFYDLSFLEVQWLSCGTLVMLFYPDSYAAWRSIGGPTQQSVLSQELEIFLAPFGIPAIHAASIPKRDPNFTREEGGSRQEAEDNIQSPKPAIIASLRQRGIKLAVDCKWSTVRVDSSNETITDDGIARSLAQSWIEWPTDLCFYRGYQAEPEQHEISWLWPGLLKGAKDPLKDAEEWIRDKQKRDSVLEKTRQETEAQAKRGAQAPSTAEDLGARRPSMMDQQMDVQGVSGVYPTPPDGFRSQVPGNNPDHDISRLAKEQLDTDMLSEEKEVIGMKADDTADNTLHDVEMNIGAYDDLEDDEMFGNLHSTMFSANGITEDDFSFFDEPKEATRMISASHQAKDVQTILPPYLTPTDTLMLSEKVEGDEDVPMSDDYDERNATYELCDTNIDNSRFDMIEELDAHPEAMLQTPENSSPRKTQSSHRRQDSLRDTDIQLSIRPSKPFYGQKDSVFSPIPLKAISRSLDVKYTDRGIYSSSENHEIVASQGRQYQVEKVVPTISQDISQNNNAYGDEDDTSDCSPTSEASSDSFLGITTLAERLSRSASLAASPTSINAEDATPVSPQALQTSDSPTSYEGDVGSSVHIVQGLPNDTYTGDTATFIQVAQLLADQLRVYSTLDRPEIVSLSVYSDILQLSDLSHPTQYDDPLRGIVSSLFPQSEKCSLETCVSTGETYRGTVQPQKAVIRPLQRRVDSARGLSENMGSSTFIFGIDIPSIQALRGENLMEISATGLQFWEELGLSPSLGSKDVVAFCIYPYTEMVHRGVASFMEQLSMTYQSLRLGTHDWGNENLKDFPEGFASVPITYEDMETTASQIDIVCERLGRLIAETDFPSHIAVIYIVNPFITTSSLPRLCESFLHCQDSYEAMFSGQHHLNRTDIVLKLIPIEWVASVTTIPLPSPREYNMLAKDVYERCLVRSNPYASTSTIQLAEPIPKTLDFKVTANPTYDLARSPLIIHVAYTWPYGSQWLCLSAIDNLGNLHWEASYCFGTAAELDPWPTFCAMAADIWSGILDMVEERDRKRSIYIVKDEPMRQEELDAWAAQNLSSDQPPLITLVLLCAEITPPIYYSPTPSYLNPNLPEEPTTYATPASTPLPTAQTPTASDPLNSPGLTKSTENLETDPSARIFDPFEESWGVISTRAFYTRKFNLGPNIQSVGSGYLLKRAGPADADGWIMLGVHIVAAEKWSEGMLKELLTQWRALGVLARERGVETQKSTLPWHLAVARKCWRGVSARMKYAPNLSD